MKQIWITRKGAPDVLQIKNSPDLIPRANEVLISVKTAGVNFSDILARRGRYPEAPNPPMVVGYEISGIVQSLGSDVSGFEIGQPVLAPVFFGGYATQCRVPKEQVFLLPDGMSFSQGAALPINYLTAYGMAIDMARMRRGDRVLIYSAGGGVGLALQDLCRFMGVQSVGVASHLKHAFLKDRGFECLIDPNLPNFETELSQIAGSRGFDVIFDSSGGQSWERGLNLLAPFGKLIAFGFSSCLDEISTGVPAFIPEGNSVWYGIDLFKLTQSNILVAGFNLATLWKRSFTKIGFWMNEILDLYRNGNINPIVDREFSFEQAVEAHRYIEERKNLGKVVLVNTESCQEIQNTSMNGSSIPRDTPQ